MKKKTIDVQDIKILNILAEHAELNNKELSAAIGLSEGPTLVRVQNLWEKGFIKSCSAQINLQLFGYNKFYLIRAEVSETGSEAMKERFSSNRFITVLVELQGSSDLLTRIFLGVFQSKSLKATRDELQLLTTGIYADYDF
jgi:DNA-binding Lrp family transcriptional regulator